eukprot:3588051-Amphidinium_carterae.1
MLSDLGGRRVSPNVSCKSVDHLPGDTLHPGTHWQPHAIPIELSCPISVNFLAVCLQNQATHATVCTEQPVPAPKANLTQPRRRPMKVKAPQDSNKSSLCTLKRSNQCAEQKMH